MSTPSQPELFRREQLPYEAVLLTRELGLRVVSLAQAGQHFGRDLLVESAPSQVDIRRHDRTYGHYPRLSISSETPFEESATANGNLAFTFSTANVTTRFKYSLRLGPALVEGYSAVEYDLDKDLTGYYQTGPGRLIDGTVADSAHIIQNALTELTKMAEKHSPKTDRHSWLYKIVNGRSRAA